MTTLQSIHGVAINKRRKPRTVARYNVKTMEKLEKTLRADPSADLSMTISENYSIRRNEIMTEEKVYEQHIESERLARETASSLVTMDQDSRITTDESSVIFPRGVLPQATVEIVSELSFDARTALRLDNLNEGKSLTEALGSMLRRSVLLCSPTTDTHLFRCDTGLVIKCFVPDQAANGKDFTQYTSIQYLESHIPDVPAPRPHGLLVSGQMAYMWMTYIPGETLEEAWPRLTGDQKSGLRKNLEGILDRMRSHVSHNNTMLGGVQGEGCKDTRRATRISSKPCRDLTAFHSFVYGRPSGTTPAYVQSVRSWMPTQPEQRIVFTHGDLRPANIYVVQDKGPYVVSGILDWEMSGFYPEWWEACKMTNCISPIDTWDWYDYLPACVSPAKYPYQWLSDRFWDRYLLGEYGLVNIE